MFKVLSQPSITEAIGEFSYINSILNVPVQKKKKTTIKT